ncbi:MAG TPA: DegV family protein [Lachnospiraceae bacterium]|nr:DegV family protein [Lachnospiraceae bacterium]
MNAYKIVVDSCCELPEKLRSDKRLERVPLSIEVGEYQIQDDESFNQAEFLRKVAEYPKCPKSSCPSPQRYMEAYHADVERVYVVTLSGKLSGSYNSAELGKKLYKETYGNKQIYVVDSESASCGEAQIAMKLMDLEEQGLSFQEIVEKINDFRDKMNTYFVLDSLETLRKNGRLSSVKAVVASTLNIKPVMGADHGIIHQRGQGIGMKKALTKMVDIIVSELHDALEKRVIISHCNAYERAQTVKRLLEGKISCREILIMDTAGISSLYANDGGVIVAV